MKKKILIIALAISMYGLGIFTEKLGDEMNDVDRIPSSASSMIAMYIQDEEGNYQLSDNSEFPKDGYVLNTEKSSCKNGGMISQNSSTKALSLKVKTSDECSVYFDMVTNKNPSADMLIAKANDASITEYNSGNKKEMFVFDHPEAEQTTGWSDEERRDYRYIGNQPNNYITFNDETWRIVGVFTVEMESGDREQLIKIIRNESIGKIDWNTYMNATWETSSLKNFLNGDYFNKGESFIYTYKNMFNITKTITIPKGLSENARNKTAKVKWYLGKLNYNGSEAYSSERGSSVSDNYATNIIQNVGLMYPSDYMYSYADGVDNVCYSEGNKCTSTYGGIGKPNVGWLFNGNYVQWLLSCSTTSNATYINSSGEVSSEAVTSAREIRPTLYLSSDANIVSGDGSQENPYTLAD